ncbi:glycosyltransferase family 2 protein [Labrys okinawensis]|uniref:glycosyltransferase family 2 protein n=1 Tax=Labrys okinawensis TaxID=346911 RepID=UPI0039BC8EC0
MPKVIVGVPVYNGGDQLAECLECLISQTLKDIEIRIYDNASWDHTGEIAQEYVRKDPRVKYVRHPENIRAMPNFLSVLRDCETEFVMWRAHDDLSSPDYIEGLYNALIADPTANVAVASTRSTSRNKEVRLSRPRPFKGKGTVSAVIQLMFNSHAGWFYGLWRRDALLADFQDCWAAFPHPWALDHLILFPSLLKRAVAVVPEVTFIQRLVTKSYSPAKGTKPPVEHMIALRHLFAAQCRHYIDRSSYSALQKILIRAALPIYVDRRVYKLRKIIKRKLFRDRSLPAYGNEF